MKKYKFHYDAGHGWLEVELNELKELGIEKEISQFSYQKDDKVYLEEDCDVTVFIKAKKINPNDFNSFIEEIDDGDYSKIRNYESYEV